jgi:CMP/dCMP kinase
MTVITIDGPSGSGKGTLAFLLASRLGFDLLDSGALYRLTALASQDQGVDVADEVAVAKVAKHLEVRFIPNADDSSVAVELAGRDVSRTIRTETVAATASVVAAMPQVREALLARQRAFATSRGLVADGRDMGTVVFPEASAKFFLEASAEERAKRRYKQLMQKGETANIPDILRDIQERDARDKSRSAAPLVAAADAVVMDNSTQTIEETYAMVLGVLRDKNLV